MVFTIIQWQTRNLIATCQGLKKNKLQCKNTERKDRICILKEHSNATIWFNFQISGFNIIRKDRENENWGVF